MALDPHTPPRITSGTAKTWEGETANKGLRENLSIKSCSNFGWKGEQDHPVQPNLLLKTGLQNAICTILCPNDLGNKCTGQQVQGML